MRIWIFLWLVGVSLSLSPGASGRDLDRHGEGSTVETPSGDDSDSGPDSAKDTTRGSTKSIRATTPEERLAEGFVGLSENQLQEILADLSRVPVLSTQEWDRILGKTHRLSEDQRDELRSLVDREIGELPGRERIAPVQRAVQAAIAKRRREPGAGKKPAAGARGDTRLGPDAVASDLADRKSRLRAVKPSREDEDDADEDGKKKKGKDKDELSALVEMLTKQFGGGGRDKDKGKDEEKEKRDGGGGHEKDGGGPPGGGAPPGGGHPGGAPPGGEGAGKPQNGQGGQGQGQGQPHGAPSMPTAPSPANSGNKSSDTSSNGGGNSDGEKKSNPPPSSESSPKSEKKESPSPEPEKPKSDPKPVTKAEKPEKPETDPTSALDLAKNFPDSAKAPGKIGAGAGGGKPLNAIPGAKGGVSVYNDAVNGAMAAMRPPGGAGLPGGTAFSGQVTDGLGLRGPTPGVPGMAGLNRAAPPALFGGSGGFGGDALELAASGFPAAAPFTPSSPVTVTTGRRAAPKQSLLQQTVGSWGAWMCQNPSLGVGAKQCKL